MNSQKRTSFKGFKNLLSKKSSIPNSDAKANSLNNKKEDQKSYISSLPLNERFPCPLHPSEHIKYFIPQSESKDNLPSFLCERCQYVKSNLNLASLASFEEVKKVFGEGNLMLPIEELPDYYLKKYDEIRDYYQESGNSVFIEDFLQREGMIQQNVANYIQEQKQKLDVKIGHLIDLFVCQITAYKDQVNSILSSQLEILNQNVKYTKENAILFLEMSQSLKNLPTRLDFEKDIEEMISYQTLTSFASDNSLNLFSIQETLQQRINVEVSNNNITTETNLQNLESDSQELTNEFLNRQNFTLHLIRKIYQILRNPPTNPLIEKLEFNPRLPPQAPYEILAQILTEYIGPSMVQSIPLQNPIENFQKNFPFESFLTDSFEHSSIDQLNYFYPTAPKLLECLHYYDHDERVFHLLNLHEINMSSITQENLSCIQIPIPPELTVARMAKTIAAPDGSIYLIGGENSAQTLVLEYQAVIESPVKISEPNRKSNPSSSKNKKGSPVDQSQSPHRSSLENANMSNSPIKQDFGSIGNLIISKKANMEKPRHAHNLAFVDNRSIYAIGGFESTKSEAPTTKCEKYLIKEDKWISIKDCQYAVSHPGLFSLSQYIFKYGGYIGQLGETTNKIEKYNVEKDLWTEVDLEQEHPLHILPKSYMLQINDQEVMVLGGQMNTFLFSDECYFLQACKNGLRVISNRDFSMRDAQKDNKEIMKKENQAEKWYKNIVLPLDERIVYQSLVYEGKLFCLTLKFALEKIVKNIFMFDGEEWKIIL